MRVELHPEAREELRIDTFWYEERGDGLGDDFVAAVDATLQRIKQFPESFPAWPGVGRTVRLIRKASVEGFPYLVAFEQHVDFALVLAVAHEKRRPLYWLQRASHGPG